MEKNVNILVWPIIFYFPNENNGFLCIFSLTPLTTLAPLSLCDPLKRIYDLPGDCQEKNAKLSLKPRIKPILEGGREVQWTFVKHVLYHF